ncbi:deoxyuridine 5'-triphosphate nucleotidohydrolase [Candidatus Saccharibacteria bacterium 32-49-12]|nr:MAG: deoxyuridine 5'-triphosphate nucleotidohydrolase [Candidatus Saccharibacteria bacterium 32-49-12]
MNIKVQLLNPKAKLPVYQTSGSAALDVEACLDEPLIIQPMERVMVPTGLAFELPEGSELQVRARSGLSIKHGLTLVNGIGTIDADYRGELNVLMINLGTEAFTIEPGMRVAQIIAYQYQPIAWEAVDELGKSDRGAGGFGSTGFDNPTTRE